MASSIADALLAALFATGSQLAWVLGPAAACAVVLHQLERMIASTLVGTFGPRALLVTGWIGVPVHELSHVAACLVFAHEIEEVKLFAPDPETGTLGVVRHRAPAGNPWAEVGRLAIGIAPLLGGALALYLAARLLAPEAATLGARDVATVRDAFEQALTLGASLLDPARIATPRFALFLYVVACIGAHLAPSLEDLGGAARGALSFLALLFTANLVAGFFGGVAPELVERAAAATTPIVALLVLAVFLSAAVLALALAVTALVERLRGGRGHLLRFVRVHWLRLAVGGAAAAAFVGAAR